MDNNSIVGGSNYGKDESEEPMHTAPGMHEVAPNDVANLLVPVSEGISVANSAYTVDEVADTSTTASELDDYGGAFFDPDVLHQGGSADKNFDSIGYGEAKIRPDVAGDNYVGDQLYGGADLMMAEPSDYASGAYEAHGINRMGGTPGYPHDQQQSTKQHAGFQMGGSGPGDPLLGALPGYPPSQHHQLQGYSASSSSAMDSIRSRANVHLQQASARKQAALLNQPKKIEGYTYQVHFKRSHRYYVLHPSISHLKVHTGDYVKVEADRGEDLGVVGEVSPSEKFWAIKYASSINKMGNNKNVLKCILRMAHPKECRELIVKTTDEATVTQICREILQTTHPLPINIVDAEYQFDRKKLIIYHDSKNRVDFREFVKDLYGVFKTRIWMQQFDLSHSRSFTGGQPGSGASHANTGWQDPYVTGMDNSSRGPGTHGANGGMPGRSVPSYTQQQYQGRQQQQPPRQSQQYAPPMHYLHGKPPPAPRENANLYAQGGRPPWDDSGSVLPGSYLGDDSYHEPQSGPPGLSAHQHRGPPPPGTYTQRMPAGLGWNGNVGLNPSPYPGPRDMGLPSDIDRQSGVPAYTNMSSSGEFDPPSQNISEGSVGVGASNGTNYSSSDLAYAGDYL
jgi:hypothetical protein